MRKSRSKRNAEARVAGGEPRGTGPEQALYQDAIAEARRLRREHRLYYDANHKAFRKTVNKAHGRVFRMKPGPKEDPRIAAAARERVRRTAWTDLYPRYIPYYVGMPEFTRAMAETGFQRKVNSYLQRRPGLRGKSSKRIQVSNAADNGKPPIRAS